MCGIVGIFDIREKREINRELLSRMNETQYHRGPDEGGLHTEAGLGFGHRRLSIIDLSSGQQPMISRDKNVVLTFNGEIYNFQELRKELEALGYQFDTHCDTEVILYGWQAWGESCVDKLRGMFAFAIWDRKKETKEQAAKRGLTAYGAYIFKLKDRISERHSEMKHAQRGEAIPDKDSYQHKYKNIYHHLQNEEPARKALKALA